MDVIEKTKAISKAKKAKRSFDAARIRNLTSQWTNLIQSINEDVKHELKPLRQNSNYFAQNDPLVKKYLCLVEENIVGSNGFQLQNKAYDSVGVDDKANATIEHHFDQWSKVCDVRGKLSLQEMERLVARSVARDGEILIRHIFDDRNKYGYSIQLIGAERLAEINEEASANKNAILSGVEIDSYGVPIAYHIYKDKCTNGSATMRIDATEISHIYLQEYPEQIRGIPWISAVMTRLNVLKKYIEFALTASAVGASTMGFFTSADGAMDALADGQDEETGELYSQAMPGEFGLLPPGYDFKSFNPNYPHTMFNDFVKGINRSIASGLSVSYNLLANDLEGVSYSSIRSSVLDERSHWESLQNTFIHQLMEPIYKNWLQNALLKNLLISSDGQRLPANKKEKFSQHKFLARRWPWVDPKKDAEAKVVLIRNKLNSPYAVAAEMGLDLDSVLDELQRFEVECNKRGLDSSNVLGNIEQNLKNSTKGEDDEEEDDDNKSTTA